MAHSVNFVGRKRELALLLERFSKAEAGEGGIVVLEGEAGIGKSRIVAEFCRELSAESVSSAPWIATGNCLEYVRSPYLPFEESLAQLYGSSGDRNAFSEPQTAIQTKTSVHFDFGDESGRAKLLKFQRVLDELRRLSRVRPLVLIIEDFHWVDVTSAELLQHIARYIRMLRLFIVITVRTEAAFLKIHASSDPARLALAKLERQGADRLEISRLSQAEMMALLGGAALPVTAIQRIEGLADGNPLYAEEFLKSALSRTKIGQDFTEDDLVQPASVLPLHVTISERLQQLDSTQRSVIQQAAVFGREFSAELLADVIKQPIEAIYDALRKARELEIIVEKKPHVTITAPYGTYAFRHALIREIIYRELLAAETLVLHERIAQTLEKRFPDSENIVAELAYHWAAAGRAEEAISYNLRAARAAIRAAAFADAIAYYNRALHFIDSTDPQTADVFELLAYCSYVAGFTEDARQWGDLAVEWFEKLGDYDKIPSILGELARLREFSGATQEAYELLMRALDLAGDSSKSEEAFSLCIWLANYEIFLGHWDASLARLDAIEEFLSAAHHTLQEDYYGTRGMVLANLGFVEEAMEQFERGVSLHAESRQGPNASRLETHLRAYGVGVFNKYGFVLSWLGRNQDAIYAYERAAEIARGEGIRILGGFIALGHARALLRSGQLHAALAQFEQGFEQGQTLPVNQFSLAEIGIALGLALGDERLITRVADPDVLERGLVNGSTERVGSSTGAFLELLVVRGAGAIPGVETLTPAVLIARALRRIVNASQSWWFLAQTALYGTVQDAARARELLAADARIAHHDASRAFLHLFDAYAGTRNKSITSNPAAEALEAAAIFEGLGWPLYRAKAFEAAGKIEEAYAIYRACGAFGDMRRIELKALKNRSNRSRGSHLTEREVEVAKLVSEGKSNRLIAEELGVRESTVGRHLESIFSRLGITSRTQLAVMVLDPHSELLKA